MSLKLLVNNPEIYNSFLEELDSKIAAEQKGLVEETEMLRVYRRQGAIQMLQKLKRLREDVNARK